MRSVVLVWSGAPHLFQSGTPAGQEACSRPYRSAAVIDCMSGNRRSLVKMPARRSPFVAEADRMHSRGDGF
jgi:hypothetical protein